MSRKGLQGMVAGMLAMAAVWGWNSEDVAAETMQQAEGRASVLAVNAENKYSTRDTQYVWITKTEKGVKYKRLYDASNKKWLTDWIRCN